MIIYVEDNPNNQRLLERMMRKFGHELQAYATAEEGLEAILDQKPELIFVDVHLKTRHTGLDLVTWLRDRGVETPIVVVTCFNMLADRKRAMAAGCDDYVSKPYTMAQMGQVVEKYLGESQTAKASV